jgi:leucyl-tRNA synthetase
MEFTSALYEWTQEDNKDDRWRVTFSEGLEMLIHLLSPFAPYIGEEMWEKLGKGRSIYFESWPKWKEELLQSETLVLPIQINGKVRGTVEVPAEASEEEIKEEVLKLERVRKYLEGKRIKRFILVPNRLVSIVVE